MSIQFVFVVIVVRSVEKLQLKIAKRRAVPDNQSGAVAAINSFALAIG
jgi:hypothetical protein